MKNFKLRYLLVLAAIIFAACSDDDNEIITPPTDSIDPLAKKEMRAVWITTAWGIDWPMSDYTQTGQKKLYTDYLDKCVELNINTIIMQIRPMGDAFYASSYEPWSAAITGTRGQNPGYDVLAFMIEETHKRGLEFHAWLNPYRIATRAESTASYPVLDPRINPEWVINHEKIQIYNPALPEVRDLLTNIVKEVITNYDVDGIHFDDYFYPDPSAAGVMVSDAADFETYGNGEYASIGDFRRANVDKAIQSVHDVIVNTKPGVLFSVSPAASDTYNYGTLYADVNKWCKEGWLDIVMPQLYSSTASSFKERAHWWPQFSYKAVPIIGHALYKFGETAKDALAKADSLQFQTVDELDLQFARTALEPKVKGNAMYSAKFLLENKIGIIDKLASIYKNPAVMPFIGRKTEADPTPATGVTISGSNLSWSAASNLRSVVYCFEYTTDANGNLITIPAEIATVVAITKDNSIALTAKGEYCITTLNGDNVESAISDKVIYK